MNYPLYVRIHGVSVFLKISRTKFESNTLEHNGFGRNILEHNRSNTLEHNGSNTLEHNGFGSNTFEHNGGNKKLEAYDHK